MFWADSTWIYHNAPNKDKKDDSDEGPSMNILEDM